MFDNGSEANIDLYWDPDKDRFEVEADGYRWQCDYRDFIEEHYPNVNANELIEENVEYCNRLSGKYYLLRDINYQMERWCCDGDWDPFVWEYEDGTRVE